MHFEQQISELKRLSSPCTLCPRKCNVEREKGQYGYCRAGNWAVVSSAFPHIGEEPVLVGWGGSGTIFFSGCNLKCVFCQNHTLSQMMEGDSVSSTELANIMLFLESNGCTNINFVTPTHFSHQIAEALNIARGKGLSVPAVYNCGGYESVETLQLLEGLIEIYMPDIKTLNASISETYFAAPDYPETVKAALAEMQRQVGDLEIGDTGTAKRGLLVRHLVMPGNIEDSKKIIDFLASEISPNLYLNVMDQYRPHFRANAYPELSRTLEPEEYQTVLDYAKKSGLRLA